MIRRRAPVQDPAEVLGEVFAACTSLAPPGPLHQSPLWQLSNAYWQVSGPSAFLRGAVPYHATNDGTLSTAAAELLVAWAQAEAQTRSPPRRITLVELGPGSGLFARIALRCYARARVRDPRLPALHYLGIDGSQSMIDALVRSRILDIDGVAVDLVALDLAGDHDRLTSLLRARIPGGTPLLAVANYLLDSLPARLLRREQGGIFETLVELRAWEGNCSRLDDSHLLPLQSTAPLSPDDPVARLAAPFLDRDGSQVAINRGAFDLIAALAGVIGNNGGILINDYAGEVHDAGIIPWQYFAGSVAMGLHFPSLDAYVRDTLGWTVQRPETPVESLTSRLLLADPGNTSWAAYPRLFSHYETRRTQTLVANARQAHGMRRLADALALYASAAAGQSEQWGLLTEVAGFLLNAAERPEAAASLARLALEANPICAPAWNILGDCAYREGDLAEATAAYEQANQAAGGDPRAMLNLAYCASRNRRLDEALVHIARALFLDREGALRPEILRRQGEILERLSAG